MTQQAKKLLPSAALLLLGPLVVLWATQAVWLDSLAAPFPWMATHIPAVLLFWALFSALSWPLWGFTRRPFWGYLPWTLAVLLLAYISRVKMNINGIPLQLSDFTLAGGLGDIAGYAADKLLPSPAMLGAFAVSLALLAGLAWKAKWFRPQEPQNVILGGVGLALLALAVVPGPVQNLALDLDEGCYDQQSRNAQEGVVLGLYSAWCQRMAGSGANADAIALAEAVLADGQTETAPVPLDQAPDIIFVASESFFDITRLEGLTFVNDPLPNYHALSAAHTHGRFLSNTYGGGTGWVEMEMFTGLTSSLLREGDTLSTLAEETYDTLPTTVRHLSDLGYQTTALHAHTAELYNRATVYPSIGFDEVRFMDDFLTPIETKGAYTTDDVLATEIITHYEDRDPDQPAFIYALSMQNHQPYYADRYPEHSGYAAQSDSLSEADLAILDALVMGLHDADASLGRLVSYFSQVDRPVMIVFVGDHLPSLILENGETIYTRLGISPSEDGLEWTPEISFARHTTDYLIWTNYDQDPSPDKTESCPFLGLRMLDRAGLPLNTWFTWLRDSLGQHMLMTQGRFFVDANGVPAYEVPAAAQPVLDLYTGLTEALVYGLPGEE